MKNREYVIGLAAAPGIGPRIYQKLIHVFGTAKKAYTANQAALKGLLSPSVLERFISFRQRFDGYQFQAELLSRGITIIAVGDKKYPPHLCQLADPPICIFAKGNTALLESKRLVAVVGTRRASSYGTYLANLVAKVLADKGCPVVSGLALGIDTTAHAATLSTSTPTIAVLGSGVNIVYPASNKKLAQRILDANGLILSEFLPDEQPRPGMFVQRNRIIAALAQGIVVIEGTSKSGSMITAEFAADLGRPVYVLPMPLTGRGAEGPMYLFKNGATMITDPVEILDDLGLPYATEPVAFSRSLDPNEEKITRCLSEGECTVADLARLVDLPINQLQSLLSQLELRGVINRTITGAVYRSS